MKKHEDFFLQNSGINNEQKEECLYAWNQEIRRKIAWLGIGNSTFDLNNNVFSKIILDDETLQIGALERRAMQPYIEQFVRDIQTSMKHFGI